jgi:DNA-binding transcriptional regulator GbsR (MarR family)
MHQVVEQFVERMGVTMEADGMPRIAGRIFGFLLLHGEPCTLDDLAERLQVSKASVSTNARLLERLGILERMAAPGDRRDYYRMGPDAWERMLRVAQQKWEVMLRMLAEAEGALPEGMEVGRERLREAERFHRLLLEEAEALVGRWRSGESRRLSQPAA